MNINVDFVYVHQVIFDFLINFLVSQRWGIKSFLRKQMWQGPSGKLL
ncbi:hypothetical protein EDF67_102286 [Sphingobacterium sp. JUb78]|nr:hypothetical protein [Sphingobacterium sp. JUb56]MCS3553332.1 hypothetical protein [Sphingobacterium sp. JUb21]MCW2262374.1 hypothetical protein [Sphingobacterium kitahiroshimense]TCR09458.1 hypothetical protein EDF66_102256 [Sphingobacterium sp. JUb20]TCR12878.1 hypothetical protein EDF67_102286 [Sphingobacterium sp. JUb78]